MYVSVVFIQGAVINVCGKEHAIFRHLDNSSQNWDQMPTEFSVLESQENDIALCDV